MNYAAPIGQITTLHNSPNNDLLLLITPKPEESTEGKLLNLDAKNILCCISKNIEKQKKNYTLLAKNINFPFTNVWTKLRGYTYHNVLEVWMNKEQDIKSEEDFENEITEYKILTGQKGKIFTDFKYFDQLYRIEFQNTDILSLEDDCLMDDFSSIGTSNTNTTSTSVGDISKTCQSITLPHVSYGRDSLFLDENDNFESKSPIDFEFDSLSGNWENRGHGITLTPEELCLNIKENIKQKTQMSGQNINQFAKKTFCIPKLNEKDEALMAKQMAAGLGCLLAYTQTEQLPLSVKQENLQIYYQQIKGRYGTKAASLLEAAELCRYVYHFHLGYWEHYKTGEILNSDDLLKKYWSKGKSI